MLASGATTNPLASVSSDQYSVRNPNRQFQASLNFTTNLFEVPRVVVPPPPVDFENGKNLFRVQHETPLGYGSAKYGDPAFLRSLSAVYPLELCHRMLAWTYGERRNAQEILPYLLLGPGSSARDADFVAENNITMLIAVRSAVAARKHPFLLNPANFASAAGRQTLTFDIDTPYEFITGLGPTVKTMNNHLESRSSVSPVTAKDDVKGKILIFCETGNERSAVLVTAYLMVVYGLDAITAIQVVQSQRFCISVDDGMKNMLLDFEALMRAERDVAESRTRAENRNPQIITEHNSGHPNPLNQPTKRSLDAAYDSDEAMEYEEYIIDGLRKGVAPYKETAA